MRYAARCPAAGGIGRIGTHELVDLVHLGVAGEKTKCAAAGAFQQGGDLRSGRCSEPGIAHVRQARGTYSTAWERKSNSGGRTRSRACVDAEPLLQKIEAAAHREGGGSEHDGIESFEEPLAQDGADVDGRRSEEHALAAAFIPIDVVFFVGFEEKFYFRAQFGGAASDVHQLLDLGGQRGDIRFRAPSRREPSPRRRWRAVRERRLGRRLQRANGPRAGKSLEKFAGPLAETGYAAQ